MFSSTKGQGQPPSSNYSEKYIDFSISFTACKQSGNKYLRATSRVGILLLAPLHSETEEEQICVLENIPLNSNVRLTDAH